MDEQLDKNLMNHIREAFENFDDPSADEGWLLLREKFPERKKDRPVIWLWWTSAAAILLLALGIGTWVKLQKTEPERLMAHKPSKIKPDSKNNNQDVLVKQAPASIQPNTINVEPAPASNKKTISQQGIAKILPPVVKPFAPNQPSSKPANDDMDHNSTALPVTDNAVADNKRAVNGPALPVADSSATIIKRAIVLQPAEKPLLHSSRPVETENNATAPSKIDEKKVKFSLYAATYFNYAKGSDNQINLGAGFTSDIKLSKNIKFSTGVAIAQNTLNYINNTPTPNNASLATAFNFSPTASIAPAGYTAVKKYNALLVGLDIPVNLKYEFNPQKSHSYVSVGLSSGTFINQTYTYSYNISGASASSLIQQPQTQTANSFSDFYFAKTLNVSFGVGYPLGKKNHLIIEPFLKYPLAGLGSQQIYFGAGGLNLKFDFQPSKK